MNIIITCFSEPIHILCSQNIHFLRVMFGSLLSTLLYIRYFQTYGIGGGLLSLLVLSVVAGNSAMGGLRLYSASIRTDQHTGHHTQGAVA